MRHPKFKASDIPGLYILDSTVMSEGDILAMARQLSHDGMTKGRFLVMPGPTRDYLQNLMQHYEHEVFAVVLLDALHRIIGFHELFRGTVNALSVYPREVVKLALAHNAVAAVFAHNHPSGVSIPSRADIDITKRLKDALALVDVRVLDHIVVGREGCTSLAETGQM
ncbi:RadC family protein [Castellaniella defragrans]|uniref:JAB domain-containing protein n=1 Tax=Castellaniella defragrans TaxID=75697 RepID=UPI002AFE0977|nr:JAB domain-containing protein [Castellaniella defragrans]